MGPLKRPRDIQLSGASGSRGGQCMGTYAKTSFLALAARPHPLCRTTNWVTGGAGGISRQASDGLSPKEKEQSGRHNHRQPARQTVPLITLGELGVSKKGGKLDFIRRVPFFFCFEVISPWPSPFPCLIPIAWNVRRPTLPRLQGNFPSSRRTGVNVPLGPSPSQRRDAQRIGPSHSASARDPSIIDKFCRIGDTKTSMGSG
jgi:hypothetical protein